MLLILLTILDSLFASIGQKVFQTDFVITIAEETTQPLNLPGTITMQGQQFVGTLFGMEMAYDGETMYVYDAETDELTLTKPVQEELTDLNPLLYAQTLVEASNLTQRDSKDGESVYITLTPKDQSKGLLRFVLKLRKADSMPLSVEMKESKKTTTLNLKNPQYLEVAPPFMLNKPDAFLNDLR